MADSSEKPLESWKEIAAYLNRDVRTAIRWEKKEGLPVHRHRHKSRSSVYAFSSEVDAWREGRQPAETEPWWWKLRRPVPAFASTIALAVMVLTAGSGPQVSGAATAGQTPTFRKIHVPTGLGIRGTGKLSPDGRQLAYVSGGSVWVLPVHGNSDPDIAGAPVRLTKSMHAWDNANVSIEWSSDGNWIGFRVAVPQTQGQSDEELYVVSVAGGQPMRVPIVWQKWAFNVHTLRYALSREARTLFFADGGTPEDLRIYSMPVTDGERRPLTEPITREPALSPDGSSIAYVAIDENHGGGPQSHQVWVRRIDGGEPVLICEVSGMTWLRSPIWSPDGKRLAFLSSAGGNGGNRHRQIWIVSLAQSGGPAGEPAKFDLPRQTSDVLAGWTEEGKIGVLIPSPQLSAVYTIPAGGGKATQLTPKDGWMASYSPDGQTIFFDGVHGGFYAAIESIPAEGGAITRMPLAEACEYFQPAYPHGGLGVSPDGKTLLMRGFYRRGEGESGIFTLPITGGEPARVAGSTGLDSEPCWSPDGARIAFIRTDQVTEEESLWNIWTTARDGSQPQRLTTVEDKVQLGAVDWSPDGELIAYFGRDGSVRVVSADGGTSRVVVPDIGAANLRWRGLAWAPDGRSLAYAAKRGIWRVPRDGGEPVPIETGLDARISKMDWSPDGKTIVFTGGTGGEHELWLVEDFEDLL